MFCAQFDRGVVVLSLTVAMAGIAGCANQDTTPTAPTTPSAPVPTTSVPLAGATISGTVVGVASAASVRSQSALTVTVTSSGSSSTVDANGHFMLTNVPTGHVDLHFMGNGVDAHLGLDVSEHAPIVITVRVSGHDAHLEDNHNDNDHGAAEVKGTIVARSLAGSCPAHNLSFMVGTTRVATNASTQFRDGTCESLKNGSQVAAKGARQTDGSILATSVEGNDENEDDDQENEVELEGAIVAGSIGGACASHSLSFKIGSTTVRTNAATEFKDVSCASLKAGDSVEVKGARQSDASVMASRVKREH